MISATASDTIRTLLSLDPEIPSPQAGDVVRICTFNSRNKIKDSVFRLIVNVEMCNAYFRGTARRYLVDCMVVPGPATEDTRVIEVECA
jgi:hypothetical protein